MWNSLRKRRLREKTNPARVALSTRLVRQHDNEYVSTYAYVCVRVWQKRWLGVLQYFCFSSLLSPSMMRSRQSAAWPGPLQDPWTL